MTTQSEFTAAVFDPDLAAPLGLSDPEGRPAGKRFDVYRNNVIISLIKAAEDTFPVLQKLIGEGNFTTLATLYARAHPPQSALMMYYGQQMPEFLDGFEPLQIYPYLSDIARLELALRRSYHAADAPFVTGEDLAAIAPDALMEAEFVLAPSSVLLRSPWPIHSIWAFNTQEDAPKPEMRAEDVLIARADYDPTPYLLPPGGGAFLASVAEGQPFGDAHTAALAEEPAFDLSAMLGLLLAGQAITMINERKIP